MNLVLIFNLFVITFLVFYATAKKAGKVRPSLGKSRDIEFTAPMKNVSVPVGQDAEFHCKVRRTTAKGQSLQLVWIRLDTQTVLAIEKQLVQNNPRISVTQLERLEFTLRIKNAQPEDSGVYACRINTKPFLQMKAHLDVLVPPVIVPADTTEHVMVKEGLDINLKCKATGHPSPVITWTREDGGVIRPKGSEKTYLYKGSNLHLRQVTRQDMATYVCMASNGVPPAVAQRINVKVEFAPHVWVEPKYTPAWLSGSAELKCEVEAYPQAVHFWYRDGNVLTASEKYDVRQELVSQSTNRIKMTLNIKNIDTKDFGDYTCTASNFYGATDVPATLYETEIPKRGAAPRADIPPAGRQQMDQGLETPETKSLKKKSAAGASKVTHRWLWLLSVFVSLKVFVVV